MTDFTHQDPTLCRWSKTCRLWTRALRFWITTPDATILSLIKQLRLSSQSSHAKRSLGFPQRADRHVPNFRKSRRTDLERTIFWVNSCDPTFSATTLASRVRITFTRTEGFIALHIEVFDHSPSKPVAGRQYAYQACLAFLFRRYERSLMHGKLKAGLEGLTNCAMQRAS
jgi:hypothetical protein